MQDFKLSLVQMPVSEGFEENLERARAEVLAAAEEGAALVVLPEMFACPYSLDHFAPRAEPLATGATSRALSSIAAEAGVHLVGGSLPESAGEKIYNTATVWSPGGELLAAHRKVHLFDVDIAGGIRFEESSVLSAGSAPTVCRTPLATVGVGICFDLRFPELFRAEVAEGAELLALPGAFNTTTGPAHWETLLRARAIENTCYVAGCSPAPSAGGSYPAWGHSMIVDPFGEVLSAAGREPARVVAELSSARLDEVRRGLPVLGALGRAEE